MNPGINGLDNALVPIDAVNVRICKYATGTIQDIQDWQDGQLTTGTILVGRSATAFENETNKLARIRRPTGPFSGNGPVGISVGPTYLVTFANHVKQVTVLESTVHVGDHRPTSLLLTNDVWYAQATDPWLWELHTYTPAEPATNVSTGPTGLPAIGSGP